MIMTAFITQRISEKMLSKFKFKNIITHGDLTANFTNIEGQSQIKFNTNFSL